MYKRQALIHRDYIVLGSEVHINMYDDRLEISSPGGMFDGKAVQEHTIADIGSMRRNPVIADLFHRMKFMERRGSGPVSYTHLLILWNETVFCVNACKDKKVAVWFTWNLEIR